MDSFLVPINMVLHESAWWPPACPALPHKWLWLSLRLSRCMQQNYCSGAQGRVCCFFSLVNKKDSSREVLDFPLVCLGLNK